MTFFSFLQFRKAFVLLKIFYDKNCILNCQSLIIRCPKYYKSFSMYESIVELKMMFSYSLIFYKWIHSVLTLKPELF